MTKSVGLVGLLIALVGCHDDPDADVGRSSEPVIVGEDDRSDWHEAAEPWRTRAVESVAAVVPSERVTVLEDGTVEIALMSLADLSGDEAELCDDVRYLDQPSLAICSATLVDDGLMLTASHCITGADCSGITFVFDYYYAEPGTLAEIDADDVYTCTRVVAAESESFGDFVFLELDRPVAGGRRPAPLADRAPEDGDALQMLGFPLGLPLKITPGEVVTDGAHWRPLIDSFSGNSGSGLWDEDGTIRGILTGTSGSFSSFTQTEGGCYAETRYPEDRSMVPASATSADAMLIALCESGWSGASCEPSEAPDAGGDPASPDAGTEPAMPSGSGCTIARGRPSFAALLAAITLVAMTVRRRRG